MGVCIAVWRCRIGQFVMPGAKYKFIVPKIRINASKLIRLTLVLSILLIMSGIEPNPGPTGRGSSRSNTNRQNKRLSSQSSQSLLDIDESGDIHVARSQPNNDPPTLNELLIEMRKDMNAKLSDIQSNLSNLNNKVDHISNSCEELKAENEDLKQQNKVLVDKVSNLESKLDSVEGQSRRNNLIFHGIKGPANEKWEDSEAKVRTILSETLLLPADDRDISIERAHRLRTRGNRPNGPIIVKFTNYKQRENVRKAAREHLDKSNQIRVAEDFTHRVRETRKILGTHLVEARKAGRSASIKFDKLIIDGEVFKMDPNSKKPVKVGHNTTQTDVSDDESFT